MGVLDVRLAHAHLALEMESVGLEFRYPLWVLRPPLWVLGLQIKWDRQ